MASKNTSNMNLTRLMMFIIFVWFLILTFLGNLFGQLGLGLTLLVGGIWALARSKETWQKYQADWKKLPVKQRNVWNTPKKSYFYFNVLFLIPFAIALGMLLIFMAYMGLYLG